MIDSSTTAEPAAPLVAGTSEGAQSAAGTVPGPLLLCLRTPRGQERLVRIRGTELLIGSGERCGLRLRLPGLAAVECKVTQHEGRWLAVAGSPNVRWNGARFQQAYLATGDCLTAGAVEIAVASAGERELPAVVASGALQDSSAAETPGSEASAGAPSQQQQPADPNVNPAAAEEQAVAEQAAPATAAEHPVVEQSPDLPTEAAQADDEARAEAAESEAAELATSVAGDVPSARWLATLDAMAQSCAELRGEQARLRDVCRQQTELVQQLSERWQAADARHALQASEHLSELHSQQALQQATVARLDQLGQALAELQKAGAAGLAASNELADWRDTLQTQLAGYVEQSRDLREVLADLTRQLSDSRQRESDVEGRIAELADRLQQQSTAVETLRDELATSLQRQPELPSDWEEHRQLILQSLNDLRAQQEEAQSQREYMTAAFAEWQTQLTARSEELERRLIELRTEQADFLEERQRWQAERRKTEASLLARNEARNAEIERAELRLAEIRAERESLELERRHQHVERYAGEREPHVRGGVLMFGPSTAEPLAGEVVATVEADASSSVVTAIVSEDLPAESESQIHDAHDERGASEEPETSESPSDVEDRAPAGGEGRLPSFATDESPSAAPVEDRIDSDEGVENPAQDRAEDDVDNKADPADEADNDDSDDDAEAREADRVSAEERAAILARYGLTQSQSAPSRATNAGAADFADEDENEQDQDHEGEAVDAADDDSSAAGPRSSSSAADILRNWRATHPEFDADREDEGDAEQEANDEQDPSSDDDSVDRDESTTPGGYGAATSPSAHGSSSWAAANKSASASHGADSDHETSIEEYMQRLLQRVRTAPGSSPGSQPQPSRAVATAGASNQAASPRTSTVDREPEEAPASKPAPLTSLRARASAPEKNADLSAMRSLATLNARKALDTHARKQLQQQTRSRLIVTIVSLCCSLLLMIFLGQGAASYLGALACLVVAAYSGFRYLVMSSRLMNRDDDSADESVES